MKRTKTFLMAGLLALVTLTGCSNGNTSSSDGTSSSAKGTTTSANYVEAEAEPELSDDEAARAIQTAKLGDTITSSDYRVNRFSSSMNGTVVETEVYYANGCYCYVTNDTVVEVQRTINVRDANATPYDILQLDEIFKGKEVLNVSSLSEEEADKASREGKAIAYFYSKGTDGSYTPVTNGNVNDVLTESINQCTVEYVDWQTETQGVLYAYVFTYGDAPLNIIGVYTEPVDEDALVNGSDVEDALINGSDAEDSGTSTENSDTSAENSDTSAADESSAE